MLGKGAIFIKEETQKKIFEQLAGWQYLRELPATCCSFEGQRLPQKATGDTIDIYRYELPKMHRSATLYYHDETREFKVRLKIGILEFCAIEYISGSLEAFEQILKSRLEKTLEELGNPAKAKISSILDDKKIPTWPYEELLPPSYAGFSLFITPKNPVRVINGSYIIADYSDFNNNSNFALYYNIFRDEFFGESRIFDIPEVSYEFDATELGELEEKLSKKLFAHLKDLRARIEAKS